MNIDPTNSLWLAVKLKIEDKKSQLTEKLQDRNKTLEEIRFIQGQISCLKEILTWENKQPD